MIPTLWREHWHLFFFYKFTLIFALFWFAEVFQSIHKWYPQRSLRLIFLSSRTNASKRKHRRVCTSTIFARYFRDHLNKIPALIITPCCVITRVIAFEQSWMKVVGVHLIFNIDQVNASRTIFSRCVRVFFSFFFFGATQG